MARMKNKRLLALALAAVLGFGTAVPSQVQAQALRNMAEAAMTDTEDISGEIIEEDDVVGTTSENLSGKASTEEKEETLPELQASSQESRSSDTSSDIVYLEPVSVVEVNPVYAEYVSEEDLIQAVSEEENGIMLLAEEPVECSTDEEAVKALREQMKAHKDTLSICIVSSQAMSDEEKQQGKIEAKIEAKIRDLFNRVLEHTGVPDEGDYLKWSYSGYKAEFSFYPSGELYYYSYIYKIPAYYTTVDQEAELAAAIQNVLSELNLSGKTDYEKVKEIYQYIGLHTSYDHGHDATYLRMFTAYAAMVDGKAVCQGYATLLYRMLLQAGIDCRLIPGTANGVNHAWNIVKLGGIYYSMDATWDSPILQNGVAPSWFLKGADTFSKHTRFSDYDTADFHQKYPMSPADYQVSTPEETDPTPEETKPTPEETKPTPEETKPTPEETKPTPEETKPALEETKPVPEVQEPLPTVSYRTHVQTFGWQNYVNNGAQSGTTGQAKRLEGIQIKLSGNANVGIRYRTHVQTYGWQPWVSDGALSGTTGQAKRLEAIQIELTGSAKDKFDVYYRVHAQTYGWLGWAKNGEMAGTSGIAKRLEAIEIVIVRKGEGNYQSSSLVSYLPGLSTVSYQTHVQTYGWQSWVSEGAQSGTTGQAKRLEGIRIQLSNPLYSGGIQYRTHVQTYGWQDWVSNGALAGTTGQAKRLEAIQIQLTGDMASRYDVYYRVHVQTYGWSGWAKNGQACGSEGYAKRLEAIQICLVAKGGAAPSSNVSWVFRDKNESPLIVVDAGHQQRQMTTKEPNGPGSSVMKNMVSSGTSGTATGNKEYAINLNVALLLRDELEARGYRVLMTRETNDVQISNKARAELANQADAAAMIRIHCNSVSDSSVRGGVGICQSRNNRYCGSLYSECYRLTSLVLREHCKSTGVKNFGIQTDDGLTGTNWCKVPNTVIELGFMSNASEDRLIGSRTFQKNAAIGIANGIDAYFEG